MIQITIWKGDQKWVIDVRYGTKLDYLLQSNSVIVYADEECSSEPNRGEKTFVYPKTVLTANRTIYIIKKVAM